MTASTAIGGKGFSAEDAKLPKWEFKYFASKDDMFDYTNGKDYTYPDGDPGICFGFEFKQTSTDVDILNTYELDLFFDDQAIGGSDSVGISPST